MDFEHSARALDLRARLQAFMQAEVEPVEHLYQEQVETVARYRRPQVLEELKAKARAAGLWNLFLPGDHGGGLTNLEYAPLAELMGRISWASEIFNCSAPDTGNMEILALYGTAEQKKRWLEPLLAGEIRSAFSMTEPQVASSDATNLELTILPDGDEYVLNGRKWWISNARHPRCELFLVMGKTLPNNPRHSQHSTIIVPRSTPGVTIVRSQTIFGSLNSPGGESELRFENVRVPKANIILGEGRGFEIAQGRLGPGRIHHCMRSIGQAQRALEIMSRRADNRVAFGKKLSEQSSIRQDIARSFCEIEMARLLTLKTADQMDRYGNKVAKDLIAAIKVVAPQMAQTVADRGVQIHGGMGVSDDTPIAYFLTLNRYLRLADGPDEVHMSQLGKQKIREYNAMKARPAESRP